MESLTKSQRQPIAPRLIAFSTASLFALVGLSIVMSSFSSTQAEESPKAQMNALAQPTLRDVTAILFRAQPGSSPDLSNNNLTELDLSDLDFKAANLTGNNLYGADLSRAKLANTNLAQARLDRALITSTDFSGANLSQATILRPTIFTTLEVMTHEAPKFRNANLSHTIIQGLFDRTNFGGANLESASFIPKGTRNGDSVIISRSSLVSCNFARANLKNTVFTGANLSYARFMGADLQGANLRGTNLTKANFTGANVAGADITGSNIDEADFSAALGVEAMIGLPSTQNRASARLGQPHTTQ